MKRYFSNKTDKVSKVTRYIADEKLSLFTDKGFPVAEKDGIPVTQFKNGNKLTQVIIFDDLQMEIPESVKEYTEVKGKDFVLASCQRQYVNDLLADAVRKVFVDVGYVVAGGKGIKKAVKEVVTKLFVKCGGELDSDGNVTKACEFMGVEYTDLAELARAIGA